MALLYDQDIEIKALRTIIESRVDKGMRAALLGKLTKDHFFSPAGKAAFQRIDIMAKKHFEIISREELVSDPVIDEDLRDVLKRQFKKVKPASKEKSMTTLVTILEKYRKIRIVYDAASRAVESIDAPEVDVDTVLDSLALEISKASSGVSSDQFVLTFGKNDTSDSTIDRILGNEKSVRIPTGFKAYDDANGGFPEKGVVIISATTSGGKSTVAMNVSRHIYEHENRSVCRISLEMDELQESRRLASHLTQIKFSKFIRGELNMSDKQIVRDRFTKFREVGKKNGKAYSTISPSRSVTIDDALAMVAPFGYDLIMIDYIGLLAGMSSESQWFQLSEVAASCKRFSSRYNCLIVILAQLDDTTDKLRYSKGIKEHADTMWQWNYTKPEQRELQILPVRVEKERDGKVFNFELSEHFDVMTAKDMGDGGSSQYQYEPDEDELPDDGEKPKKKKKKKAAFTDDDDAPVKKRKKGKKKGKDDEKESPESYALA